jgi:hypothetical protein
MEGSMLKLIRYEIKKNLKKKSTIIVTGLVFLIFLITFISTPFQEQVAYYSENEIVKKTGLEAIKVIKNYKLPKLLSESFVYHEIKKIQDLSRDQKNLVTNKSGLPELKSEVIQKVILPKFELLTLIADNYHVNAIKGERIDVIEKFLSLSLDQGAKFYQIRSENIKNYLNHDLSLNKQKKHYFKIKEQKVKLPIRYGYHLGWSALIQRISVGVVFTILVLTIFVSATFTDEYTFKMDALLLSSKLGAKKIAIAKIISTYVLSTVFYLFFWLVGILFILGFYGFEGWDLPVQVIRTTISFSHSLWQVTLLSLLSGFFVMLGMVTFTLYLSAKIKSTIPVILSSTLLVIFFNFFIKEEWSQGFCFLFSMLLMPYNFYDYYAYSLGNLVIPVYGAIILFYTAIICVCLPLSIRAFQKHQIA